MFCPECKAEYRDGFTQCADCDLGLVDVLVEPGTDLNDDESGEFFEIENPVEIERFLHVHQSEFAVSVLDGSGIKAWVDQPFTGHIAPHFSLMTGGIRLVVEAQHAERAVQILRSAKELSQGETASLEDEL
jgi:hypothetical protein